MDEWADPALCPECGVRRLELSRFRAQYQEHTQEAHERHRVRLYGAVARLLNQVSRDRLLVSQAGAQGLAGIRAVSGVYRGLVVWHTVTREFWDELGEKDAFMGMTREWLLRHLRGSASDCAKWKYGVEVNPATWRQKVYDGRQP